MKILCDYCQKETMHVTGKEIYPHRPDLWSLNFWQCKPCKAYVGCHKGTLTPLGRLANAELRAAKMAAHGAFDQLWKFGKMNRTQAYKWLSTKLKLTSSECHIAMFDVDMCKKVVLVSNAYIDEQGE